ncbi:MAG: endonuclease/exonuclease/phosphatase family protein [Prevotellaceae bacterium]|nr:endonuclease/exonuclease/phosphatase family protein [Prevotellaceae bacterium]
MIGQFKKFTLQMIAGANIATAIIMLLIGFSDRISPENHPILSSAGLAFPALLFINVCFLIFFIFFKRRYIIIPLAGFILCYSPIRNYFPLNISKETPSDCIKVLSYNVYNYNRENVAEGEKNPIIEYIIGSDADIVCLQEAKYDDNIISEIKNVYLYRDSVLSNDRGECLALFCKFPILSKEKINYKSKGNVSGAFKIKIGKDTVTVINNHFETSGLSLADRADFKKMVKGKAEGDSMKAESKRLIVKLGESAKIRAPQAEAVAKYIRETKGSIILCGDFNDNPISYTHYVLDKELTDCYISTANGPGISYHHNAIFVRIDNIMCSSDWEPYNCKVDNSIAFSDHYPIFCWLKKRDIQ